MASMSSIQTICAPNSAKHCSSPLGSPLSLCSVASSSSSSLKPAGLSALSWNRVEKKRPRSSTVVNVAGDVSADGTTYLIAGAVVVAILGTAFPILFTRKDICPVCDGAGFVRKSDVLLKANAARKDLPQIVCANCNGLGKLNQVDKK